MIFWGRNNMKFFNPFVQCFHAHNGPLGGMALGTLSDV
jgi:hypothetical protein